MTVVVILLKLLEFDSNIPKSSKIGLVSNFQRLSNSADFSKMSTNVNFLKLENLTKEVTIHNMYHWRKTNSKAQTKTKVSWLKSPRQAHVFM